MTPFQCADHTCLRVQCSNLLQLMCGIEGGEPHAGRSSKAQVRWCLQLVVGSSSPFAQVTPMPTTSGHSSQSTVVSRCCAILAPCMGAQR